MLLQRFGAIFSNISGSKNADLEAFTMAVANNTGKLYPRLSRKISVWMAYFMGLHVEKLYMYIFAGITL